MKKYYFTYFFSNRKKATIKNPYGIYDFIEDFENNINADEVSEKEAIAKICDVFADEIRRTDHKAMVDYDKGIIAVYNKAQISRPIGYYFIGINGFEND